MLRSGCFHAKFEKFVKKRGKLRLAPARQGPVVIVLFRKSILQINGDAVLSRLRTRQGHKVHLEHLFVLTGQNPNNNHRCIYRSFVHGYFYQVVN
mmetsp:Transcript_10399/g.12988  ORF Transcript_10399/g.12988 Transcript_10399/m.12988 type:complete len:95 (+) Transcript_10399:157-441(+)